MDVLRENQTIIGRLGIISENRDVLSMKMRFERLFSAGNFLPAGLSPRAIICIKKLRDPAPQTLNLQTNALRSSDAWENAVAREIEKLYYRAARPNNESVPAQAECIVFSDRAEMLACLASDWCTGNLFQNWWWRSLFPHLERAQTITKTWLDSAEFVPPAMEILFKKGLAEEFVTKLQPEENSDLLKKIIQTFGLNKVYENVFTQITKLEKTRFQEYAFEKTSAIANRHNSTAELKSHPAFQYFNKNKVENLIFERKIFLFVSLALARSPRFVRSDEFAEKVRRIKIETESFQNKTAPAFEENFVRKIKSGAVEKKSDAVIKPAGGKKSRLIFTKTEIEDDKKPEIIRKNTADKSVKNAEEKTRNLISFSESKQDFEQQKPTKNFEGKFSRKKQKSVEKSEVKKPSEESKEPINELLSKSPIFSSETIEENEAEIFETVIHTKYGGVFFLLNFALYLKLYRDFSEPLGAEIDLNIWDFVALLSLEFVGEKVKKDAVWNLLTTLAGREKDEKFPADFSASSEWRISGRWLETFPKKEKWFWANTNDRLIVRHSENFNVFDIPSGGKKKKQLESELKKFAGFFSEIEEARIQSFYGRKSLSDSWLKNFYEFAGRRLAQSLNLENRNQLREILFERSATVAVSATNFEASFRLADLPLAVRFSGLDRNPGWIPAAGKYVEFHFV